MSGTDPSSINPFSNFTSTPSPAPAPAPSTGIAWGSSVATSGIGGAWGASSATYDVDTTYVPISQSPAAAPSAWAQPQGAWHNTHTPSTASTFLLPPSSVSSDATVPAVPSTTAHLAFTDSTAAPVVKGTLGSGAPAWRDDGNFAFHPSTSSADPRPLLTQPPSAPDPTVEDTSKYAFYNIRKYRPYFNVDTQEVLWRVTSSFIGAFKPDFMQVTHTQPDLYGPFWIATTLIFVTAAAGNFSSYIAWKRQQDDAPDLSPSSSSAAIGQWFADTTKLGTSAAIFYGYAFVISLLLWLWVRLLKAEIKLVNMFCVYGYALTIFIPISVICVAPVEAVRWVFVVGATLMSGGFLLMNMRDAVAEVEMSKSIWLLGAVGILHMGLGVALKLFFFNY